MKTYMANAQTVERKWYVVDAAGLTLGRLINGGVSIAGRYNTYFLTLISF